MKPNTNATPKKDTTNMWYVLTAVAEAAFYFVVVLAAFCVVAYACAFLGELAPGLRAMLPHFYKFMDFFLKLLEAWFGLILKIFPFLST